jgi:hypothetical protein
MSTHPFDERRKLHATALTLGTQMLEARQMLDEVGEGYYEAWDDSVRVAVIREMAHLQERIEALREKLNRPVEPALQGDCLAPMRHDSGVDFPCILPALHLRFDGEDHLDIHGHGAKQLVSWSTIEEVRRVQDMRDRGEIE